MSPCVFCRLRRRGLINGFDHTPAIALCVPTPLAQACRYGSHRKGMVLQQFDVLKEASYRRFIAGYGVSYVFYWITLLSIGWWMWEKTGSAAWVGLAYFCDLAPAVVVTPIAAALADRGDRFRILKTVLWLQVLTGLALASVAAAGALTPGRLVGFA